MENDVGRASGQPDLTRHLTYDARLGAFIVTSRRDKHWWDFASPEDEIVGLGALLASQRTDVADCKRDARNLLAATEHARRHDEPDLANQYFESALDATRHALRVAQQITLNSVRLVALLTRRAAA